MVYLILALDDRRILHISATLDYQDNGNYLIHNGTLAVPPSICELAEVDAVPDGVEPERWCFVDGEFSVNPNWREPEGDASADIDAMLDYLEGKVSDDALDA